MEFRVTDLMIDALPAKKKKKTVPKRTGGCPFPPPCKSRTNQPTRCRPGTSTNACTSSQPKSAMYDELLSELRQAVASGKTLVS